MRGPPRDLAEAERIVRSAVEAATNAEPTDRLPEDWPHLQLVAVCQLVTAMLDDLREAPVLPARLD